MRREVNHDKKMISSVMKKIIFYELTKYCP